MNFHKLLLVHNICKANERLLVAAKCGFTFGSNFLEVASQSYITDLKMVILIFWDYLFYFPV